MNTAALFLTENTSTALPSGGLDSLFFPSLFLRKPLIEVTPNSWTTNYWGSFYVKVQSRFKNYHR